MKFVFLCLFIGSTAFSATEGHELFQIQKLGKRSYFVKTKSGKSQEVGSNSGFIILKDSVLVIDAHMSPEVEKQLITEIKKTSPLPVRYLVITHPHKDHISGASAYGKSVIRVNSQSDLPRNSDLKYLDFGASHSSRDVVLFDEKDSVAFMGDLFVNGYVGYLAEANFKKWINALKAVEALKPQKLAPGHGKLGTLKDLKYYRVYLSDFAQSTKKYFEANQGLEGYELPDKYKNLGAKFFLENNIKHAFNLWKLEKL